MTLDPFTIRCLDLWRQGLNTYDITGVMQQERWRGRFAMPISEAETYNALSRAHEEIYQAGR